MSEGALGTRAEELERGHHQAHDMTNSHLLVQDFDYYEPGTVDQAVRLLAEKGDEAAVLAGGTFLLVQMKMEQTAPGALVNVGRLPGLSGLERTEHGLDVGGMTTIWELRNAPWVQASYAALADACAAFGSTQIQLTGTLGGNVCNGSPASDTVPALAALGAELALVGPNGERVLPIEDFLVGPGETAIEPGELLTVIRLPEREEGSGSAFVKVSRVRADLAKASAAAWVVRDGDTLVDCRLTFGAVGPTVIRATEAEEMVVGERFSSDLALEAGKTASRQVSPIDDVRSSAEYRRQVVCALAHDALVAAFERAGDEKSRGAAGRSPAREQGSGRAQPAQGAGERGVSVSLCAWRPGSCGRSR